MSSSARMSPARRPGPDGYGRQERGSAVPPRSGRSGPPPNQARGRASGPSGRGGPAAGRRPAPRSGPGSDPGGRLLAGAPNWLPAAAILGGPIAAAILGKLMGGYHGPVFVVLTIVSAGIATAAATANGRWWVVSALPPVAWLVSSVAELAWHNPPYPNTKEKLVGLVHATTNVFPVILAALVVMGLVIAVAVMRDRQSGGGARQSGGGGSRAARPSGEGRQGGAARQNEYDRQDDYDRDRPSDYGSQDDYGRQNDYGRPGDYGRPSGNGGGTRRV